MEWRYYGVELPHKRRELFGRQLLAAIQERKCSQRLPAVRSSGKIGSTCFAFVAHVEDEDELPSDIPDLVREVLGTAMQNAGLGGPQTILHPHEGGFRLQEISRFSGAGFTTEAIGNLRDLFRSGAFRAAEPVTLDLSLPPDDGQPEDSNPELVVRYEHLLAWASATGGGTWDRFASTCAVLGLAGRHEHGRLRSIVRHLMLLGHLQLSPDEQSWAMCSLSLVQAECEPELMLWCGPRTAAIRDELIKHFGQPEPTQQPGDRGPPRLAFRTMPVAARRVSEVCGLTLRVIDRPALAIASALPEYSLWVAGLRSDASIRTAAFTDIRRYDGHGFDTLARPYEEAGHTVGEEGLYELSVQEGPRTYCYLDAGGVWRAGDFFSLRYAGWVGARHRSTAGLRSDGAVITPIEQQWPLLHQRCLALASGLLPRWSPADRTLTYPRAGADLLRALAAKLPFDIQEPDDA